MLALIWLGKAKQKLERQKAIITGQVMASDLAVLNDDIRLNEHQTCSLELKMEKGEGDSWNINMVQKTQTIEPREDDPRFAAKTHYETAKTSIFEGVSCEEAQNIMGRWNEGIKDNHHFFIIIGNITASRSSGLTLDGRRMREKVFKSSSLKRPAPALAAE